MTKAGEVKKLEYKSYVSELKVTNDGAGELEGILNAIGNIDDGDDRTMKGAFKRTIEHAYARKQADPEIDFLWPYLWNHDYNLLPPGGIYDADEIAAGLFIKVRFNLDYQLGRDMYSSAKFKTLRKQSMGFRALQHEYVKDKDYPRMIRNLLEVQVVEGSGVVFPMNDLSDITGVKARRLYLPAYLQPQETSEAMDTSLETKTIYGDTTGPIGPRDEAWDSGKAEQQIWAVADKGDKLDTKLAQKYFLELDGNPMNKTSYNYPFWYVGDSPHICVGAVKAVAGAVQGARGADAPTGLKAKVETLYKRINSKYPDATPLTPPWKSASDTAEHKTFADHFAEGMCGDLIDDWTSVYLAQLTQSIFDAWTIGDTPQSDISDALDAFKEQVMSGFVAQGMLYGLPDYLAANPQESPCADPSDSSPMSSLPLFLMSARKSGRVLSGANQDAISNVADDVEQATADHAKKMGAAAKKLRTLVASTSTTSTSSDATGNNDSGTPQSSSNGKARDPQALALAALSHHPETSTDVDGMTLDDLALALSSLLTS